MIYFITFILTLSFSHIARAAPACGDVASPEEPYDPTFADAQHALPIIVYNVTWSSWYDNPNGNTKALACFQGPRRLPPPRFEHFKDLPNFPFIGGAIDIKVGSPNCGRCWNLTHLGTNKSAYIIAVDRARTGFNISKEAFTKLNGNVGGDTLQAEAKVVSSRFCHFDAEDTGGHNLVC